MYWGASSDSRYSGTGKGIGGIGASGGVGAIWECQGGIGS